jgi:hypothetical protein
MKQVAPRVGIGERQVPQLIWRRKARSFAFATGLHIDALKPLSVGAVRESNAELAGIAFRLTQSIGQGFIPCFGFDDGELGVAVDEHVVGLIGFGAGARAKY